MTATLTHSTPAFGGAAKPASLTWFARLILALANWSEFVSDIREEERKAHARYPHLIEW